MVVTVVLMPPVVGHPGTDGRCPTSPPCIGAALACIIILPPIDRHPPPSFATVLRLTDKFSDVHMCPRLMYTRALR